MEAVGRHAGHAPTAVAGLTFLRNVSGSEKVILKVMFR
jgi:hypothetical protein